MKILFLSLSDYRTLNTHGLYSDLLREFIKNGHEVYMISPVERRKKEKTHIIIEPHAQLLKLQIGNMQKTNIFEKAISMLTIESQIISGIKKYYSDIKFDLILYATPPITFYRAIKYVKKRDNAKTYLLLKDIFPQNAVDLGIMQIRGIKCVLYKYFRKKEKQLYAISDKIGCMSQANVDYVITHNPEILANKVEICPNCIEIRDMQLTEEERVSIRDKYNIPQDKKVFVYGGNLGKPQGISFLIECLKPQENNEDAFFLIVGNGTEFGKLQDYFESIKPKNMKLMRSLPKDDYDKMIAACDIGLIFLDYRFTIPNFPSRLLSYMQAKIPVLAVTDTNTDIGKVIVDGGFGWWCESDDVEDFCKIILSILNDNTVLGEKAFLYLKENYSVKRAYEIIMKDFNGKRK